MGRRMVRRIKEAVGLEDVFLAAGALSASVGAGIQFGYPFGLIVGGVLCLSYGIWLVRASMRGGDG